MHAFKQKFNVLTVSDKEFYINLFIEEHWEFAEMKFSRCD